METKTKQVKFKLTDKVKITDVGKIYTTYRDMFKKLNFQNQKRNDSKNIDESFKWEVFGMAKHEGLDRILIAIKNGDRELLIEDEGLFGVCDDEYEIIELTRE